MLKMNRRSTPVFLVLFFFSGACALIYEVVWTRLLTVVIGNTVFSVTAVLTVLMAGLALGGRIAGGVIDRKRIPLIRSYAAIEAVLGIYNLALPWLLRAADPVFGFVYSGAYQSPRILAASRLRHLLPLADLAGDADGRDSPYSHPLLHG